jgi:hypothetical protein
MSAPLGLLTVLPIPRPTSSPGYYHNQEARFAAKRTFADDSNQKTCFLQELRPLQLDLAMSAKLEPTSLTKNAPNTIVASTAETRSTLVQEDSILAPQITFVIGKPMSIAEAVLVRYQFA